MGTEAEVATTTMVVAAEGMATVADDGTTSSAVDHLVMVATTIVAAKSTNKTGPCKAVGHASFSRREDTVETATPADSLTYGETDSEKAPLSYFARYFVLAELCFLSICPAFSMFVNCRDAAF